MRRSEGSYAPKEWRRPGSCPATPSGEVRGGPIARSNLSSDKLLFTCDSGKCGWFGVARCGAASRTLQISPDERLRRFRNVLPKVVPVTFRSEKQLLMQLFSAYRPSILLPNAFRVDEKGLRRRTSRSWSASYGPFPRAHRALWIPGPLRSGSRNTDRP